jgi:hypothetical protein
MKLIYSILITFFAFGCNTQIARSMAAPEKGIELKKGTTYNVGSIKKDSSESQITEILQILVNETIEKNYSSIFNHISKEKGIYIDLKSWKSREEFVDLLKLENNYIEIYFFTTEKLSKEKRTIDVRTVRDLLILSSGLTADLYFESDSSCEVKLQFLSNKQFESELNNPYFIKLDGKWYLHRLF